MLSLIPALPAGRPNHMERDVTLTVPTERGSDYAGLSRQIRAARLLDRARWHYAWRITATAVFFVACWWAAATVGNSWFVLVAAGVLGLASTQIAFLGHDGGHQQIAASRAGNTIVGLVAGLLTGLSTGWWADKHNRHHANPNKEDHDPDIGEGVLAFTTTHAASRTGPIARMITAHQAVLFFPLLTLEGLNLHVASARWLARTPGARLRRRAGSQLTGGGSLKRGGRRAALPGGAGPPATAGLTRQSLLL